MISFDIAKDLVDHNSFLASEGRGRRTARAQESLPQVGKVLALLEETLTAEARATLFRVSPSEPAM